MLKAGIDGQQWSRLRSLLLEKKILVTTVNNRYVFMRDPAELTLLEINNLLGDGIFSASSARGSEVLAQYPWSRRLASTIDVVGNQASAQFSITLQDLFNAQDSELPNTDAAAQN